MSTADAQRSLLRTDSLGALHWVGIAAALVSAAVHFLLGIRMFPTGLAISFLLAGFGFVGAVVLVVLDYRRRLVYAVGIPFTVVQIVAWYYVIFVTTPRTFPADMDAISTIDKLAQVVLVAVLVALLRE